MDSKKRRIDKRLAAYIYRSYRYSGKTQEELAERINVDPRTLKYYFNGQRKPSQITLLKLLKALDVNVRNIPF